MTLNFIDMATNEIVDLRLQLEKELERRANQKNDWNKLVEMLEDYTSKYGAIQVDAQTIDMNSRFGTPNIIV